MEEIIKVLIENPTQGVFVATASDEFGVLAKATAPNKVDAVTLCKNKVNLRSTRNTFRRFIVDELITEE